MHGKIEYFFKVCSYKTTSRCLICKMKRIWMRSSSWLWIAVWSWSSKYSNFLSMASHFSPSSAERTQDSWPEKNKRSLVSYRLFQDHEHICTLPIGTQREDFPTESSQLLHARRIIPESLSSLEVILEKTWTDFRLLPNDELHRWPPLSGPFKVLFPGCQLLTSNYQRGSLSLPAASVGRLTM